MLQTDIDVIMKTKQFLMLAATNTIFFAYCILGKIFEEVVKCHFSAIVRLAPAKLYSNAFVLLTQNEMIVSAVYSTPWYYLQPEDRKTIYLFLCHVQKPTRYFAFGVYPVTMATFPRVMNVVYSYINLLRTSLNVHRSWRHSEPRSYSWGYSLNERRRSFESTLLFWRRLGQVTSDFVNMRYWNVYHICLIYSILFEHKIQSIVSSIWNFLTHAIYS